MMISKGFYKKSLKRPSDFTISLIALLILSPVFIVVALLVRTKLGSPVLFSQTRPGLHGKIFRMYKFRTMTDETDMSGELLPDAIRLTSFGRFLRSTSLDELPGLINIIKGDMSLIGPRPLLVEYLPLYSKEQAKRHNVRPGLSGLAQVSGRNLLTWEEKFKLDIEYVQNVTFMGDIKLILLTLKKVIVREGISATNHVTVEPFKGRE
ncbi:sugar transferase [Exiguobacterium sp. SH3S2]|uniref:sugar transferase n=1 Tax=unclassified Exiguobacterium TaxID=2644629 RepID=UPI001039F5CC|nr:MULTISPECIES: sugar transferase [unclassified Exiguobacterium]TCI46222.1 sugar transferase [Exiguobacterium sp. SH3S3]TCI61310.1 sugar transferase [Exiguobacterium sp. SH3S2]